MLPMWGKTSLVNPRVVRGGLDQAKCVKDGGQQRASQPAWARWASLVNGLVTDSDDFPIVLFERNTPMRIPSLSVERWFLNFFLDQLSLSGNTGRVCRPPATWCCP